jgi:flagellar motor protein MotB
MPTAEGDATVESKAGRTEIEAKFDKVHPPTRYGAEYLTYVLWAITPEGHPKNLGEVLVDGDDDAKLEVTTDLQAFGMIVTAEPYSAVRQPSDVVVLENEVRPNTVGRIEHINAKYELMPRGHYTYEIPAGYGSSRVTAATVPFERYEEILNVYQAQNAVQIARAAGADRYAPDTFAKAERLLREAQDFQVRRVDRSTIVTAARQAAQTAEDARAIAEKRKQEEEVARAREQVVREQQLRARAEAEIQRVEARASADRMQLDEERAARQRAEIEAAAAKAAPPPPPAIVTVETVPVRTTEVQKSDLRVRLWQDLGAALPARDTPRGIVVTVQDHAFRGGLIGGDMHSRLARIASIVASRPGLYVQVEGHTDNTGSVSRQDQLSYVRAAEVRDVLVRSGVPAGGITVRGLGSSRPLVANSTAAGREQNRRVEITIAGDPIGVVPTWDRTYPLVRR